MVYLDEIISAFDEYRCSPCLEFHRSSPIIYAARSSDLTTDSKHK